MISRVSAVLALLIWTTTANASGYLPAYNKHADPKADFTTALAEARSTDKKVMIIFGSEWCSDCRSFDKELRGKSLNDIISEQYVVIKADIGNWDQNMDFAELFGNPAQRGIPSLAIVDPKSNTFSATPGDKLASLRYRTGGRLTDWFSWQAKEHHEAKILLTSAN